MGHLYPIAFTVYGSMIQHGDFNPLWKSLERKTFASISEAQRVPVYIRSTELQVPSSNTAMIFDLMSSDKFLSLFFFII